MDIVMFEENDGMLYPVVMCEACGELIRDPEEGVVLTITNHGNSTEVVHSGCVEDAGEGGVDHAHPLDGFLYHLRTGTGYMAWSAERRASAMGVGVRG